MEEMFKNPHLVIPALTYIIAQSVKMFLKASKGDFQWKYMFSTGDMPSVHTAVATSLLVSLGFIEGVGTAVFAVGAFWALFIIYDSFNVRRAVGEQGGVIMQLIELSKAPKDKRDIIKVREVLGHTPLEVLAGAGTGLGLGLILSFRYWPDSLLRAFSVMGDIEKIFYYGLFVVVIILGTLAKQYYIRKNQRRLPTSKRVRRIIRTNFISPSLIGIAVVLLHDEGIRFFTNKTWLSLILLWIVISGIVNYVKVLKKAKAQIEEEEVHFKQARKTERKSRSKKRKRN